MVELSERITKEVFAEAPGQPVTSRVRAMGKVLGNIVRDATFSPVLVAGRRRDLVTWSRRPIVGADVVAWRRRVESWEAYQVPSSSSRDVMAAADAGLALWIREHRHLPILFWCAYVFR
jgi:hypothetical protein